MNFLKTQILGFVKHKSFILYRKLLTAHTVRIYRYKTSVNNFPQLKDKIRPMIDF